MDQGPVQDQDQQQVRDPGMPESTPATSEGSRLEPVSDLGSRGRRGRWIVALVVAALVVAAAAGAFIAVSGASGPSTVARWAPADSVVYAEARFDLPGDQRAGLGSFLSAFPGFADQTTLDAKLAELYDRIIRAASNGAHAYSTEIAPWFGGQLGLASSAVPTPGVLGTGSGTDGPGVLVATTKDSAKASAWLATIEAASSLATTASSYGGVALTVGGPPDRQFAAGVDGTILVVGDVASVHAVIDTHGTSGLASTAPFGAALAATPNDHLAFAFLAPARLAAAAASGTGCGAAPAGRLPAWSAFSLTASDGHLVGDAFMPAPAAVPAAAASTTASPPLGPLPTDRVSVLAARLPGSTIAVIDLHDVGGAIDRGVATLTGDPSCASGVASITAALDRIGGLASFTSWLGDAAIVVTHDSTGLGGGLVVALPDAAAADVAAGKFAGLKNLVALAGGAAGSVTSADDAGTTITTIDFGALGSLVPAGSVAPGAIPAGLRASFSYAIHGGLVIVGVGGYSFVRSVLDLPAGSSLADQPRYQAAMTAAGGSNVTSAYVDLRAVIDTVAAALPADRVSTYANSVRPYLDPLGAIALSVQAGDIVHVRFVVTLR